MVQNLYQLGKIIIIMSIKMNNETINSIQLSQSGERQEKKKAQYIPGEKIGKWQEQEQLRYIVFLDFNKELMRSKEKRSSNKFYEEMACFIETRNALQCRSHHQKLQEKYSHFTKIIKRFKKTFNKVLYRESISSLGRLSKQTTQYQSNNHDFDLQLRNLNNNIEVQTDLGGVQKKFLIIHNRQVKIEQPMPEPIQFAPQSHHFVPNNVLYHYYPHYFEPCMTPYFPMLAYHNRIIYQ